MMERCETFLIVSFRDQRRHRTLDKRSFKWACNSRLFCITGISILGTLHIDVETNMSLLSTAVAEPGL